MKMGKHFPILYEGKETTAEILAMFVAGDDDLFLAVEVSGDYKLYQVLPNGLKDAPKTIENDFIAHMCKGQKEKSKKKRRHR